MKTMLFCLSLTMVFSIDAGAGGFAGISCESPEAFNRLKVQVVEQASGVVIRFQGFDVPHLAENLGVDTNQVYIPQATIHLARESCAISAQTPGVLRCFVNRNSAVHKSSKLIFLNMDGEQVGQVELSDFQLELQLVNRVRAGLGEDSGDAHVATLDFESYMVTLVDSARSGSLQMAYRLKNCK